MKTLVSFFAFVFGLLSVMAAPPDSARKSFSMEELDALVLNLMRTKGTPGLAVAVVENGRVVWEKQYGVRKFGGRERVDENTVFEAASLSKPVFAFAVMKLVEKGMLDLDAPLCNYLPTSYAVDENIKKVTARMVLTHTAGFPNANHINKAAESVIRSPGERFQYSNSAFNYLKTVVEFLTKEPFHVYMKEQVFKPLGMNHSSFVWESAYESNYANGHRKLLPVGYKSKPAKGNAAAGLHTTAGDYARFLAATVRPKSACVACPSANTLRIMLEPQQKITDQIYWALGWGLELSGGAPWFWHWGHNIVFTSYALANPVSGSGVVILTNSSAGLSLCKPIVQNLFGGQRPSFAWIGY